MMELEPMWQMLRLYLAVAEDQSSFHDKSSSEPLDIDANNGLTTMVGVAKNLLPGSDGGSTTAAALGNSGDVDLSLTEHRDFQGKLLHQAAIYSNFALLEDLLKWEQRRYINERDSFGRTALHAVCAAEVSEREESIECVRLLLEAGADPNIAAAERYNYYTPLHVAAKDGKVKIASLLVQYGADLENRDIKRLTPLELARNNYQTDCVSFLQTTQVERERLRSSLEPSLLEACSSVKELRQILRRIGYSAINREYKETPLYRAALGGHLSVVKFLLDHHANGKPNRDTKQTPLYAACLNGHFDVAKLLLQHFPAMASDQTNEMEIPLHAAAKQGNAAVIKLLLEFDYKSALDEKGFCQLDQSAATSTFKSYKGDLPFYLNLRNINGQTALYLACTAGHVEAARALLEYRPGGTVVPNFGQGKKQAYIDVDCYTVIGRTPLHSAVTAGNIEIVALLLKHGADVNLPVKSIKCLFGSRGSNASLVEGRVTEKMHIPKEDNSILCEACSISEYNLDIIAMLLKHGARDPSGKALLSATLSVRSDVVTTILAHTGVHPDPDYVIGEEYQTKIKLFVTELTQTTEGGDCHSKPKTVREAALIARTKVIAQESKKDHSRKGSTYDRRRTFGGLKRAASTLGMFDTPVAIDWHDQNLNDINPEWLVEASLRFNTVLRTYPQDSSIHISVATITRIDISDNSLSHLPLFIFKLPSLQHLNASKNKMCYLPGMPRSTSPMTRTFPGIEDSAWNAPMLRRINLSSNRLVTLPPEIFMLPVLENLNMENNHLRELPFEMWMAPKLKTLNLSRNILEELPCGLYGPSNNNQIAFREVQCRSPSPLPEDLTSDQKRDTFPLLSNQSEKPASGKLARLSEAALKFGKAALRMKDLPRDSANMVISMSGLEASLARRDTIDNSPSESPETSDSEVFEDEEHSEKGYSIVTVRRFRLCSTGSIHGDSAEEENANIDEMNALETLDLSHNKLTHVPVGLPCLAPRLTKLVLCHNKITDFGPMNKYPVGLMDLELSFNCIKDMSNPASHLPVRNKSNVFRLLRSSSAYDPSLGLPDMCYSPTSQYSLAQRGTLQTPSRQSRDSSFVSSPPGSGTPQGPLVQFCKHRRHRVLATLRTLDLSSNQITQMDVIARTVLGASASVEEETPGAPGDSSEDDSKLQLVQSRGSDLEVTLLFPSLNALSVANNMIGEVPSDIQYLTKLSSLKLNGNEKISTLPPELGRLNMYDLKVDGCRLTEPLASMFKTELVKDILGYLRSILDDAKPYTRMKLMFVGKACIGKTTLLNELRKDGVGSTSSVPETFAERQGNTSIGGKTLRGKYLSTVGVDVSEWTYNKKRSKYGKVTFSTWDFGGQEEFYATHQYFLTKRSLYLVLFKITDGMKSINQIQQWLVNIQARAPNSPVLLIGTHYDLVNRPKSKYSREYWPDLKRKIMERFIHIAQPQDVGLPNVIDCIEISCLPMPRNNNLGFLRDRIYDVAFSLTEGRDKEPMLMQRVPTCYLALEKAVMLISSDMRRAGTEPVLHALEYRTEVTRVMLEQYQVSFHSKEDLMHATRFLHNNGILLHYEDSMLSDYFFLDPQWLCDTLAKIVTIPEINPDVKKGVMLIKDLHRKFQDSSVKDFILNLLNKCEVAVTYDNEHILVPSRLPVEGLDMTMIPLIREKDVIQKESPQTTSPSSSASPSPNRCWNRRAVRGVSPNNTSHVRNYSPSPSSMRRNPLGALQIPGGTLSKAESSSMPTLSQQIPTQLRTNNCSSSPPSSMIIPGMPMDQGSMLPEPGSKSSTLNSHSLSSGDLPVSLNGIQNITPVPFQMHEEPLTELDNTEVIPIVNQKAAIRRLYILQYIPSGFWSHMISRFLSDQTFCKVVPLLYPLPERLKVMMSQSALDALEKKYQWTVWQTGVELRFFGATIFHVKEIVKEAILTSVFEQERRPDHIKVVNPDGQEPGGDRAVSLTRSGQLEILIPNQTLNIIQKADSAPIMTETAVESGIEALEGEHIEIASSLQVASRLLSSIMDLIDTLMENFYPSICEPLGITFQGELFITRLVPCNRCWRDYNRLNVDELDEQEWEFVDKFDFDQRQSLLSETPVPRKRSQRGSNLCCGLSCTDHHGPYSDFSEYTERNNSMRPRARPVGRKHRAAISQSKSSDQSESCSQPDTPLVNDFQSQDLLFSDQMKLDLRFTNSVEMNSEMMGDVQVYGFLFEMLVMQAMKTEIVTCPIHGRVKLSTIAPDVVFHDLGPALLVDRATLEVRRLLGSGTFGLVFQGQTSRSSLDTKVQVAIKMLQPFPPGQGAGQTDRRRYEAENAKWHRDPLRFSCEAFRTARKELSIMLNLEHPQIVPLIGFCRQPMSLILELAPEGALDSKLEDYKRVGARLTPCTFQKILVQVSSAVAYLHQKGIIYRDLKAENVLVWCLPAPHSSDSCVKVKLADYGISVTAMPSGTKGYGGTPGYMAPEIVQYDGKEKYTEKVDCFSFAMFMYELMAIQRPFENLVGKDFGRLSEIIKQLIKDGQRPVLTKKEKLYPTYMVDLMAWCWAQDSRDRPSMEQINAISRMPEFPNLREIMSPQDNEKVTCACAPPLFLNGSITDSDSDDLAAVQPCVWMAQCIDKNGLGNPDEASVLVLNVDRSPGESSTCVKFNVSSGCVECMCAVVDTMWLGLTSGAIAVYGAVHNAYQELCPMFTLPLCLGKVQVPKAMVHVSALGEVMVATDHRIIVVSEDRGLPDQTVMLKYVEFRREVFTLAVVPAFGNLGDKSFEIWCGQSEGHINIVNASDLSIAKTDLNHQQALDCVGKVSRLVTYDLDLMEEMGLHHVWSWVQPGPFIYKWNVKSKKIEGTLDVITALATCRSNSKPRSRRNVRPMSAMRNQVSSLAVFRQYLYVGVSSGNLLVADPHSLKPLCVINCHEGPVRTIVPVATEPWTPSEMQADEAAAEAEVEGQEGGAAVVVTVGRGFNDLIGGYVNSPSRVKGHERLEWYFLLWETANWEQGCPQPSLKGLGLENIVGKNNGSLYGTKMTWDEKKMPQNS
ncbi:leucine-rich repeat serine/threonine-protein kinase 1-like isoform X2 [Acanthaster planci]|uniref:non-specific serine/threonine protein kinase n=1 Tax=Acanthaster planci TaxID=133434 RepID=A0A8B7ZRB9_ACAPL|nr:leucine-rich repeat serine/threonine-protein kinase 1-like isoform X2 [Acanthaster planci]